jgi:hypothetical protein
MDEVIVLTLLAIASMGATFARFSGVVVVFGQRADAEWLSKDRFRLVNMIVMSLGTCVFSLWPLVLSILHLSAEKALSISSTVTGISLFLYFFYAVQQAFKLTRG